MLEERTIQDFRGELIFSINDWGVLNCSTLGDEIEKWKNPEPGKVAEFLLYSSLHKNVKFQSWEDVLEQTEVRSFLETVSSKKKKRKGVYHPLVYYSVELDTKDSEPV